MVWFQPGILGDHWYTEENFNGINNDIIITIPWYLATVIFEINTIPCIIIFDTAQFHPSAILGGSTSWSLFKYVLCSGYAVLLTICMKYTAWGENWVANICSMPPQRWLSASFVFLTKQCFLILKDWFQSVYIPVAGSHIVKRLYVCMIIWTKTVSLF